MKREKSTLELKQEKWAKEKEDSLEWFPFGENGKPGGGSPLRSFVSKEPPVEIQQQDFDQEKMQHINSASVSPKQKSPEKMAENHNNYPPNAPYMYPAYTIPYPYYGMPPPQQHHVQQNGENVPQTWQFPYPPQYQVIPPNAIPVSTISIDPSKICPLDSNGMWRLPPPGMGYGIPVPTSFVQSQQMTSSVSSSESGVSGVRREISEDSTAVCIEEKPTTSDYDEETVVPELLLKLNSAQNSHRSTGLVSMNYEDQIRERKRYEEEEEENERRMKEEVERQRRILEQRAMTEEEKRKEVERKRIEEENRRTEQFRLAKEKAEKEAECLRKARLFKHVYSAASEDDSHGIDPKMIGMDAMEMQRMLNEVDRIERHKRQDEMDILMNGPSSKKKIGSTSSADESLRSRSASICMPKDSPSPLVRNGAGRRSVRTTSREKVEAEKERTASKPPQHHHRKEQQAPQRIIDQNTKAEQENRDISGGEMAAASRQQRNSDYYLPINRDPYDADGENFTRISGIMTTPNGRKQENDNIFKTPTRATRSTNISSQAALFGPVAVRSSVRRSGNNKMRAPITLQSPTQPMIQQQNSFERDTEETSSCSSPDPNHNDSPLPSSTENVHPKNDVSCVNEMGKTRTFGSPSNYMNASAQNSRCSTPSGAHSRLMQRLEQKGYVRREEEESISENVRKLTETNLSRSPSLASLHGSFQNLSIRGSMLNLAGEPSPNLSRFHSVNSPARQSLNAMRKTTDRQVAVLDRLNRLRESLHAGKNYTPPRSNGVRHITPNGVAPSTPPMSPRV